MKHLDEMLTARGIWNPEPVLEVLHNYNRNKRVSEDWKPKRLNSDLAKKVKSLGRIYSEVYQQCAENSELLNQLENIPKVEIIKYAVQLERINREQDPAIKSQYLAKFLEQLKITLLTYLGLADTQENRKPAKRLAEAKRYGLRYWGK